MKMFPVLCLSAAAASLALEGCSQAAAAPATKGSAREVALTIYKDDFAMVSEKRTVPVAAGNSTVSVANVSRELDASSLAFGWDHEESAPQILGTSCQMGAGSTDALRERLNGQPVEMLWNSESGRGGQTLSGTLEATGENGGFAVRSGEKLYVNPNATVVAPSVEASALPEVHLQLNSPQASSPTLKLSYLSRGMSWSADYAAVLDEQKRSLQLECWATITNTTGTAFPSAKVTLVAGSPNRATRDSTLQLEAPLAGERREPAAKRSLYAGGFGFHVDAPVGELVEYPVGPTVSIGNDQINRVNVFGTRTVPVDIQYSVRLPEATQWDQESGDQSPSSHLPATVALNLVNSADANLGMSLPAGTVRVYQTDAAGQLRFTGASSLPDTTVKAPIHLTAANAFNVYAEYFVRKVTRLSKHVVRKSFEVLLHNAKSIPVDVTIVQSGPERWHIVSSSVPATAPNSSTKQWVLSAGPQSGSHMVYTADFPD